jgi:hypothetical protein
MPSKPNRGGVKVGTQQYKSQPSHVNLPNRRKEEEADVASPPRIASSSVSQPRSDWVLQVWRSMHLPSWSAILPFSVARKALRKLILFRVRFGRFRSHLPSLSSTTLLDRCRGRPIRRCLGGYRGRVRRCSLVVVEDPSIRSFG